MRPKKDGDSPKKAAGKPFNQTGWETAKPINPSKKRDKNSPPLPAGQIIRNQCRATAGSTGKRCARAAILGGAVCRSHGGAAPQVIRSARARLAELALPAIETLNAEREDGDTSADRIRAAVAILDRAGFGVQVRMEIEDSRQLLLERLLALREETPPLELEAAVVEGEPEDVVDAEPDSDEGS